MSLIGDLLIRIGADQVVFNQFHDQLNDAKTAIKSFAVATGELGEAIEAGISEPISKVGDILLGFQEDVKAAQNTLIGMTGQIGDDFQNLAGSLNNVFAGVPQSIGDVATVMGTLAARLNLTGAPLEDLTKQLLDLARVTGEQVAPLVETSAKLFAQWQISTEGQAGALDHLLQVAQASGAKVSDIESTLAQFGPALQEVGLSFGNAADLIGTLTKAGVNVQPVLQGIQKSLATMTKAGLADPIEGLQLLITQIKNANTEGQAFAIGATAFGKGAASMVTAIRSGKIDLDSFTGSLKTTDQTIADTAERMLTLGQKWQEVKNQVEVALAPIGDAIERVLEQALEQLQPVTDKISELGKAFTELSQPAQDSIIDIGLFAAGIAPALGAIALLATGIDLLEKGFKGLSAVFGEGLGASFIEFAPAVAGVAAAFAIFKLDGIIDAFTDLGKAVDANWSGLKDLLPSWTDFKDVVADLLPNLGELPGFFKDISDSLAKMKVSDWIDVLQPQLALLREALQEMKNIVEFLGGNHSSMNQAAADAAAYQKGLADINATAAAALVTLQTMDKDTAKLDGTTKTFSGNALAAYAQLTAKTAAYAQTLNQIKLLQQQIDAKSLPIEQLKLADLQQRVYAPTATDADTQMLAYYDEIIKLNRAANRQTSDDTIQAQADLLTNLKIQSMDRAQAFSLLGVTSSQDLENQVREIVAAQGVIDGSAQTTADDRIRIAIATSDKELAIWRQEGASISDDFFAVLDNIKTQWASLHLDLGQAFGDLGLTSVSAITNQLTIQQAALEKIQEAVRNGAATQVDADNAEIASLQKKQAAFAQIGQAITDEEVSELKRLQEERQASAMTTDQAFEFLGLPSQNDLTNQLNLLDTAFTKIQKDQSTSQTQMLQATAAYTAAYVALFKKAGQDIGDDFALRAQAAGAAAAAASQTIVQAFQNLGVLSTAQATQQIALLQAAFDKVANSANSTAADIQNALVSKLAGTIAALQKSGQAVSDTLVNQLDALTVKIKATTMTIDQAYSTLGVEGLNQFKSNLALASAALDKINADMTASDFQRLQAQVNYNEEYYKNTLAIGGQIDEYDKAQNDLQKQRIQQFLSDQTNIYTQFAATIKGIYGTIQGDLTDVITGAKTLGQAFTDIGQQIEKALVDYVVKNLILTQNTLNSVTSSLLGVLHDLVGGFGGTSSVPSGLITGGGSSDDPGAAGGGGGSGASATGGLLSQLGSITGAINLVVGALSDIVQGFQLAHLISTSGKIEENTRRIDITMEGPDGIMQWVKEAGADLDQILGYLQSTQEQLLVDISSNLDVIAAGGGTGGGGGGGGTAFGSRGPTTGGPSQFTAPQTLTGGGAAQAISDAFTNAYTDSSAVVSSSASSVADQMTTLAASTAPAAAAVSSFHDALGNTYSSLQDLADAIAKNPILAGAALSQTTATNFVGPQNGTNETFTIGGQGVTEAQWDNFLASVTHSGTAQGQETNFVGPQTGTNQTFSLGGQGVSTAEWDNFLASILPGATAQLGSAIGKFDFGAQPAGGNPFAGLTYDVGNPLPTGTITNGVATRNPAPAADTTPVTPTPASAVTPAPTVNLSVTVTGNTFASQDQFTSSIDAAVQSLRNNAGLTT